jgi:hypothetical protein
VRNKLFMSSLLHVYNVYRINAVQYTSSKTHPRCEGLACLKSCLLVVFFLVNRRQQISAKRSRKDCETGSTIPLQPCPRLIMLPLHLQSLLNEGTEILVVVDNAKRPFTSETEKRRAVERQSSGWSTTSSESSSKPNRWDSMPLINNNSNTWLSNEMLYEQSSPMRSLKYAAPNMTSLRKPVRKGSIDVFDSSFLSASRYPELDTAALISKALDGLGISDF